MLRAPAFLAAFLIALLPAAQSADERLVVDDEAFEEKAIAAATVLHGKSKLVALAKLRTQLKHAHCELTLPEPRKDRLAPREVYRLVIVFQLLQLLRLAAR